MEGKSVEELAQQWLKWDVDPETRAEIAALVEAGNTQELALRLEKRIDFGTAGLRGAMKAGFHFMNELTVTQATQGLLVYLRECFDDLKESGVVVGYDGRYHSLQFARRTAAVFLREGIKVHLFSEIVPTPFVSYGVLCTGSKAGVMVTASHNPKNDNGYKLYWANGSQIVAPIDKEVRKRIQSNLEPWELDVDQLVRRQNPLLVDPMQLVASKYYEAIVEWNFHAQLNARSELKIVFTPMHGVGAKWVHRAFEAFQLRPYFPVMQQLFADPDFSTVEFPNPEEGKGALALSMEAAKRVGAPLIIANDPDSDRCAAAELQKETGEWHIFSGNQIGTLLADWLWQQYRKQHPEVDPSKCLLVNTTVSSKMLKAIADAEGLRYEETLTGFKWMGNLVHKLEDEEDCKLLLAYEQAIGFMIGSICPDKDGVRAAAVLAEMANYRYEVESTTLYQHLQKLNDKYGYHASREGYFFCYDPKVMASIFDDIRSKGQYTKAMGKYGIARIRDLTTPGFDNGLPENKPNLPVGSGQMITFFFDNGAVLTLRGSGTEPKLKYYAELPSKKSGEEEAGSNEEVEKELDNMLQTMVKDFLKPEQNDIVAPKME